MNYKKTFIVAILFAAVVAAYQWDQRRIKREDALKTAQSRLVAPKREAITGIILTHKDSAVELAKLDKEWQITKPLPLETDAAAVDSLLNEIDKAQRTSPFPHRDKLDDYGLKTPATRVQISAAGEKFSQEIEIGGKTPDGVEAYASFPKAKEIFTIPSSLADQFGKPLADWRDKRVLPANVGLATSLTLASSYGIFYLEKKNETWRMVKPIGTRADGAKIEGLLRDLNEAKASDFKDTSSLLMLRPYGLHEPSQTVSVMVRQKDKDAPTSLTVKFGYPNPKVPNSRYAMRRGGNCIFSVSGDTIDKFKLKSFDLRSKKLFTLGGDDVGRAIFDVRGKVIDVRRDSAGKWRLVGDDKTRLDNALINQKIGDLTAIAATHFFDKPTTAVSGLGNPILRVTLVSKDGKTTESLYTGRREGTGNFVYACQPETGTYAGVGPQEPGKYFLLRDAVLDKAIFDFDPELVQKIELTEGARKLTFKKEKSGGWVGVAADSKKERRIEGASLSTLIYSIGALNWSRRLDPDFANDAALIKVQVQDAPLREFALYDGEGKELGRLRQGSEKSDDIYLCRGQKDYMAADRLRYASVKSAIDDVIDAMREGK